MSMSLHSSWFTALFNDYSCYKVECTSLLAQSYNVTQEIKKICVCHSRNVQGNSFSKITIRLTWSSLCLNTSSMFSALHNYQKRPFIPVLCVNRATFPSKNINSAHHSHTVASIFNYHLIFHNYLRNCYSSQRPKTY